MSVTTYITVEDVNDLLDADYTDIELERAVSVDGAYSLAATIPLVADDTFYSYLDLSGTLNSWYRYRFVGLSESDYSNPWQLDAASRLKIRQKAIEEYGAGMVFEASGGSTTTVTSVDYRIRTSRHVTGRGEGMWVYPATGAVIGQTRNITDDSEPATGTVSIEPSWATQPANGDTFEYHTLVSPEEWNKAINRGLARYSYSERVPIIGDNTGNQSLADLPWLKSKRMVTGIWYRPTGSLIDLPWGNYGRWWDIRQDGSALVLLTSPKIDDTTTLYLEATRRMDPLYTDDSVAPAVCALDLACALAYDEVLANLTRPQIGSTAQSRAMYYQMRVMHQKRLARLLELYAPSPKVQVPQTPFPVLGVPRSWRAR